MVLWQLMTGALAWFLGTVDDFENMASPVCGSCIVLPVTAGKAVMPGVTLIWYDAASRACYVQGTSF